MAGSALGVLIPALTALAVAMGAVYKNWVDGKTNTGTNAVAETREALAAMGKLNDMLLVQNAALEAKVARLERLVETLREHIDELRRSLEKHEQHRPPAV